MPSAYIATLPFRTLPEAYADLPDASATVPTAAVFSNENYFFPLLDTLFADLRTPQPLGMGDRLNDANAVLKAIQAYAGNLERIQPGAMVVKEAKALLQTLDRGADILSIETLKATLLTLQHREIEVAIKTISALQHASNQLALDGLSGMLPSAMRIDQSERPRDPKGMSLWFASAWMLSKSLVPYIQAISRQAAQTYAGATVAMPSHQRGKGREDLLSTTAVSSRSNEWLRLAINHGVWAASTPRQIRRMWGTAAHPQQFEEKVKLDFTAARYVQREMPSPNDLVRTWEKGRLTGSDVSIALQTLVDLPVTGDKSLQAYKNTELDKWFSVIRNQRLPSSFGDILVHRWPMGSVQRVDAALAVASDATTTVAIETCTEPMDVDDLLRRAAAAWKPSCAALLLARHPDPAGLAALLPDVVGSHAHRPRDVSRLSMLAVVKQLVEARVDVNHRDPFGNTVLHHIAGMTRLETDDADIETMQLNLIRLLLTRGAQINAANLGGKTPLTHRIWSLEADGIPARGQVTELLRRRGGTIREGIRQLKQAIRETPLDDPTREWRISFMRDHIKTLSEFRAREKTATASSATTVQASQDEPASSTEPGLH